MKMLATMRKTLIFASANAKLPIASAARKCEKIVIPAGHLVMCLCVGASSVNLVGHVLLHLHGLRSCQLALHVCTCLPEVFQLRRTWLVWQCSEAFRYTPRVRRVVRTAPCFPVLLGFWADDEQDTSCYLEVLGFLGPCICANKKKTIERFRDTDTTQQNVVSQCIQWIQAVVTCARLCCDARVCAQIFDCLHGRHGTEQCLEMFLCVMLSKPKQLEC